MHFVTISNSKVSSIGLSLLLAGCAASGLAHRPAVIGDDLAFYDRDLQTCQQQAANDRSLDNTKEAGILGAAAGAIVGAIANDAIEGAVVGAIIGVTGGNVSTQKNQREYIIKCMQDLGYNVVADNPE